MNGKAKGMEAAVEKWKTDLEYVRSHRFGSQKKASVESILKWSQQK